MLIGYARVSTIDQKLDLQIDALQRAGCEKIFTDTVSGGIRERKGLNEALEYLRNGDILVVWRLDRLGRSVRHLVDLMNSFKERGIGFKSISETIDTATSIGQFFFHITAAFAELERNLIRERTQAGLSVARARGRKGGRKKAIDSETFKIALQLYNDKQISVSSLCKRLSINERTFYRYLANL